MPEYVCKSCGKEMFSLTEVVEYWDDIYCKGCDPGVTQSVRTDRNRTRTPRFVFCP